MVSWQTTTASLLGRLTVKQLVKREVSVEKLRQNIRALERLFHSIRQGSRSPRSSAAALRCGMECAQGARTDQVILHFPGGAYVGAAANLERGMMARLCRAANARARLVFYRLAPEHPFPAGHEDCLDAYRQLLGLRIAPDRIMLSGISAGGGLALGVLMAIRDKGLPMPAGAIALSPLTDLLDPHDETSSRVANALRDPVLSHRRGMAMRDLTSVGCRLLTHPTCRSPWRLRGLPPLYFQVRAEILYRRQPALRRARQAAGVIGGGRSLAPDAPRLAGDAVPPESDRAIRRMGDFIRSCCPDSVRQPTRWAVHSPRDRRWREG
jgi:acetyl esterase/lipase